jgi:hypothetical protein
MLDAFFDGFRRSELLDAVVNFISPAAKSAAEEEEEIAHQQQQQHSPSFSSAAEAAGSDSRLPRGLEDTDGTSSRPRPPLHLPSNAVIFFAHQIIIKNMTKTFQLIINKFIVF